MTPSRTPPRPPRVAERLLALVLPRNTSGGAIRGDLREEFAARAENGNWSARAWYCVTALQLAVSWIGFRAFSSSGRGRAPRPSRERHALDGVLHDVRSGLRSLRHRPGVTAVAIATLAIGIGATGSVFTIINAMFLRPLPYQDPESLVLVWERNQRPENPASSGKTTVNPASYFDWHEQIHSLSAIAAFNRSTPIVSGAGNAERPLGAVVTPEFFDVLGVHPALGRGFAPENGEPGGDRVVILSYGYWQRKFGGDPDVIGRSLLINGVAHEVLGVMPASYRHPEPNSLSEVELIRPLTFPPGARTRRTGRYLRTIARLAPGYSAEEAYTELAAHARRLATAYPDTNRDIGVMIVPVRTELFGSSKTALFLFLGAAVFVLLITCANVANLLLARMLSRGREFAMRTALGAGWGRLGRQVLVEVLMLTLAGGAAGLAVAGAMVSLLRGLQGTYLSSAADVHLDLTVVAFTLGLTFLTTMLVGIGPVIHSARVDVRGVLAEEGANTSAGRRGRRVRNSLVVSEVTLAVVLLVGAGLLLRSFSELMRVPPGFRVDNVLTLEITTPSWKYRGRNSVVEFFQRTTEEIEAVPGVRSVGVVSDLPFTNENRFSWAYAEGSLSDADSRPQFEFRSVGPGYFETMDVELLAGRTFRTADAADAPPVVIVNRALAQRLWPGAPAVGQHLVTGDPGEEIAYEVIGVVGDVLDDGFASQPEPRFYYTYLQSPQRRMSLVVSTQGAPGPLIGAVREAARRVDPEVPVSDVKSLDQHVIATLSTERLATAIAGAFAGVALFLSGLGIYGVVACSMGERTREIGIRSALGARRSDVLALVIRQSMQLVLGGLAVGALLSLGLNQFIGALLFGIGVTDLQTLAGTTVLLVVTGLAATYLPARRAVTVSPVEALRGT